MAADREPTIAHRLEFALFRGVAAGTGLLGDTAGGWAGACLARLGHRPFRIRRAVVERNLRYAFPDRDDDWIRRTARKAYAHLGREAVVLLRLASLRRRDVIERTRIAGLPALRDALDAGRGVVAVTGHFGNWELAGAALTARGVPLDVVAQRQQNPLFDRMITDARERLGMRVIDRGRAPKLALRALRRGRAVGFVADQNARTGIFVPFFGRPASTHRGPALLAVRTGAPVFLVTAPRADDGRYDVRVEPVEIDRSGDGDAVVQRLTAAFTERLEAEVRRAPTQYLWHHRRWKRRPAEEPASAATGIV